MVAKEHEVWEHKTNHSKLKQQHDASIEELEKLQGSVKSREKEYGTINKRALQLIKEKEEEHAAVHRKTLAALDKKEQDRSAARSVLPPPAHSLSQIEMMSY